MMEVAIEANLKNGLLYQYRIRNRLSRRQAAKLAGVRVNSWCYTERLLFEKVSVPELERLADFLGVLLDELCPHELRKFQSPIGRVEYREVQANLLMAERTAERLTVASPYEIVQQTQDQKNQIKESLSILTYREREIIKLRYGIGDGYPYTLEEVGKIFKVTRERVRQTQARAISKLRDSERLKTLVDLVG